MSLKYEKENCVCDEIVLESEHFIESNIRLALVFLDPSE